MVDAAGGDLEEIDGRGLSAIPGLVDCHTHACFGGDRVNEFSLRAGGASYEELHAAGGGILSTVRATRAASEAELAAITARHRSWMRAHGTTTFEGKSGYGLDHDTELAQLRAVRAAGGIPTWLGAHTVPPEFDDGDTYIDFLLAEVLPEACQLAEAADVFLERGSFDAAPVAPLPRGVPRRGAGSASARRPVHGVGRDRARDRARREIGRPPRGDRAGRRGAARRQRRRRRPASGQRPLPRQADAAGSRARRCRCACRARHRLQPGQRLLRQPAARPLPRLHPAEARARGSARRRDRQRRPRARAWRTGSVASSRATRRTSSCSTPRLASRRVPPGRRRRPHGCRRRSGRVPAHGIIQAMATQKQRKRRAKEKRHDYDLVYIDEDGVEQPVERAEEPRKPTGRGTKATLSKSSASKQPSPERPRGQGTAAALMEQGAQAGRHLRADLPRHRDPARRQQDDASRPRSSRRSCSSPSSSRSATSWIGSCGASSRSASQQ